MKDYFVLADANNFFAACEKIFVPKLEGQPVIVLSSNDGCVVSRSQEAKQIGIQMGEPYFKIKELCKAKGVFVFSSNFELYGDISERMMNILSCHAPDFDIYSIDEAFLKFPSSFSSDEIFASCLSLRLRIKKWIGIDVSFGISHTKTLAKLAAELAKKSKKGVFDLTAQKMQQEILKNLPIEEIWGIGRHLKTRLNKLGIYTAAQFAKMEPLLLKKKLGVAGQRMQLELSGTPCFDFEAPSPKKSITCSRSFGKIVTDENELREALATFISRAAEKLRSQKSLAKALSIYLEALVAPGSPERSLSSIMKKFHLPTNCTNKMITAASKMLKKIYRPGEKYKKCGVLLLDFESETQITPDLFSNPYSSKNTQLMKTLDSINARFGKHTLFFATEGINPKWKSKKDSSSPYNTTNWKFLPKVFTN